MHEFLSDFGQFLWEIGERWPDLAIGRLIGFIWLAVEKFRNRPLSVKSFFGILGVALFLAAFSTWCRNMFHIDERVEIFRAGQIRKVDDTVSHLGDFAAHFFSRSQVQLDRFAHAALKDPSDACVSLQAGLS